LAANQVCSSRPGFSTAIVLPPGGIDAIRAATEPLSRDHLKVAPSGEPLGWWISTR
jgi:hypothetical protein